MAEEFVPFVRELAALVARSPSGQGAAYPVVQTVQVNSEAPAIELARTAKVEPIAIKCAMSLFMVILRMVVCDILCMTRINTGGMPCL